MGEREVTLGMRFSRIETKRKSQRRVRFCLLVRLGRLRRVQGKGRRMAAAIGALVSVPMTAICTLFQGASCALSTANMVSCLFQSATGKRTGVSPTAAKLFYILLLGLSVLTATILRYHSEKLDFGVFGDLNCPNDGTLCKGNEAVFRISFILVLFFTLMTVLSLASEDFHRGYWGIKVLVIIAGVVGSFFIPHFNVHAYAWFARVGSTAFLVLQILLLIDFAYQINDSWVARAYGGDPSDVTNEATNHNWLYGLLVASGGLYVTAIVGVVLLFVFYASCPVGVSFTVVSMLSIIVVTLLAIFRDKIVDSEMQGAIFPTAFVSAYVIFLCWSALESNPDAKCRPKAEHSTLDFTFGALFASVTLMWSAFSVTSNAGHLVKGEKLEKAGNNSGESGVELAGPVISNDLEEQMVSGEDEDDTPVYSHEQSWMFHLIMVTASTYMAMLLTDWGSTKGAANAGEASMWMKIVAQWLTTLLFGWTLIAPAILKDRDWDF